MFLYHLPLRQKRAFPVLAAAVIRADDKVLDLEHAVMAQLNAELGPASDEAPTFEEALTAFDGEASRRAALIELIGIVWCDGEMADAEAALIDDIADEWSIALETRAAILDWVSRQTALLSEAARLIGG